MDVDLMLGQRSGDFCDDAGAVMNDEANGVSQQKLPAHLRWRAGKADGTAAVRQGN